MLLHSVRVAEFVSIVFDPKNRTVIDLHTCNTTNTYSVRFFPNYHVSVTAGDTYRSHSNHDSTLLRLCYSSNDGGLLLISNLKLLWLSWCSLHCVRLLLNKRKYKYLQALVYNNVHTVFLQVLKIHENPDSIYILNLAHI